MCEMIQHKYGTFNLDQIEKYKTKIRKKIFWLIIYTDKETNEKYQGVDVVSYHESIMEQLDGFNSLLSYPTELVEILSLLQSALMILKQDNFNFIKYKKKVLDAGALVQSMKVGG